MVQTLIKKHGKKHGTVDEKASKQKATESNTIRTDLVTHGVKTLVVIGIVEVIFVHFGH